MKPQQKNDPQIDLSQYAYTSNLTAVENAAANGTLEQIPGYTDVMHWSVLGFDLLIGEFVDGASEADELEDKLIESFGRDYSLRYTILEFAMKAAPASPQK